MLIAILSLGNTSVVGELTPVRMVIFAGLTRAIFNGTLTWNRREKLDFGLAVFSVWAIFSSFFHSESLHDPYIERIGLVANILGAFLYARVYFQGEDFLFRFSKTLIYLCIPLCIFLLLEQASGRNYYSILGSRAEVAIQRGGFRAQGPFGHAIIAGTVGACIFPLAAFIYKREKKLGIIGMCACFGIAFASRSSGPLAALGASFGLLYFWRHRHRLNQVRVAVILMLIFLNFTMSRPIWFLIARIDIVGGSTGWHRSKLIDVAMGDWRSWWFAGTDYTRHWMHSGVGWNPNHTDITNYYLQFGVQGGMPLMFAFVYVIFAGLRRIEKTTIELRYNNDTTDNEFAIWCVGVAIASQCISFISIAYFDQMYAFFFGLLGLIPAVCNDLLKKTQESSDYIDAEFTEETTT